MKRTCKAIPFLAFVTVAACVTVNVYFPAAAIRDLSRQIEEEVQEGAAEGEAPVDPQQPLEQQPVEPPGTPGPVSLLDALLGATPAYADTNVGDPEVTNPAIRKIIESRRARVDALNGYKASGVIGENNQALVEIRNLEALSDLKARAELQRLVKAENSDRQELFREIAVVKKVDLSQLPKVQETYAATLRDIARPGDWIQLPDGTWKQK